MNAITVTFKQSILNRLFINLISNKIHSIYPQMQIFKIAICANDTNAQLEQYLSSQYTDIALIPISQLDSQQDMFPVIVTRLSTPFCLISNDYDTLDSIPNGKTIIVDVQLLSVMKYYYPQLKLVKLEYELYDKINILYDSGLYSAIVVASYIPLLLGLSGLICCLLNVDIFVPKIGQGVFLLQGLSHRLDLPLVFLDIDEHNVYLSLLIEQEIYKLLSVYVKYDINVYARFCNNNSAIKVSASISNESCIHYAYITVNTAQYQDAPIGIYNIFSKLDLPVC